MNGLLLWIIIVLLILLIGFVGVLIAAYRMLKEQANAITTYKEIEGIITNTNNDNKNLISKINKIDNGMTSATSRKRCLRRF